MHSHHQAAATPVALEIEPRSFRSVAPRAQPARRKMLGHSGQDDTHGGYSSSPSRPSTGVMVPKRPCISPSIPAVKNRVVEEPAFALFPKANAHRPSMVRTESSGFLTMAMNLPVKPLKAAIWPLPKFPTRMA